VKRTKINPKDIIVCVISLIALVIGSFALSFFISFICVATLNIVYFWRYIKIAYRNIKKKTKKKTDETDEIIMVKKDFDMLMKVNDVDMKKGKTGKGPKKKRGWIKTVLQVLLLIGCFFFVSAIGFALWFVTFVIRNAPVFIPENLYSAEPSVIYFADGEIMATVGTQNRVIITYDELPEVLINALVATEDANFFQHNGVDLRRFMVASIQQIFGNTSAGGASTLTMQLAKNYVTQDTVATGMEGIVRKFTDVYMAVFHIEPAYTKEEIIEFYVNSGQLGGAHGIEAAAQLYFNKSARDLNLSESAMLVGMYQAPTLLNPYINPDLTEERRLVVLSLMLRHGYINAQEHDIARRMTVERIVVPHDGPLHTMDRMDDRVRSAVDIVVREVKDLTGFDPRMTSMQIHTTIDQKLQLHVGDIMTGKTYNWENDTVQAGVAVVNVRTGGLVAVGGNRDNTRDAIFNHAVDINYQTGSSAKAVFGYAPAIEFANWSTGTLLSDEPMAYSTGGNIQNWDRRFIGINTARHQLAHSRNIPAVKAFQAVSREDMNRFVRGIGLNPEQALGEAHALGGYNGESPLTMAAAHASFANGGNYTPPYTVTRIIFNSTGETRNNRPATTRVMSDSTAYIVNAMMQESAVVGLGFGQWRNIHGLRWAGKTGTTNFDRATINQHRLPSNAVRDLWMIGYNNQYSIAVWYGYNRVTDGFNRLASGQNVRLFHAVALAAFQPGTDSFTRPSSVVSVVVETDNATLMLPSEFTPANRRRAELFVRGTEPTTISPRFARLRDVSNLSGSSGAGTATLSWSPIPTPDAFNAELLTQQNRSAFVNDNTLNAHVSWLISQNRSQLGTLGYNVYVEGPEGLRRVGRTTENRITIDIEPGTHTFVVRSTYSNFAANASPGVRTTITVN